MSGVFPQGGKHFLRSSREKGKKIIISVPFIFSITFSSLSFIYIYIIYTIYIYIYIYTYMYVYIDTRLIDAISWVTFCIIFLNKRKMEFRDEKEYRES